jgi:two-component sensor histidine kinase
VRELHHRVRNNLAVVQAMAAATARTADSIEGFSQSISARIAALAKVHTLLSDDYWQTAPLEAIFKAELKRFVSGNHPRVKLTGRPVDLSADLAVPLSMALHELSVNAVRHGSLSAQTGGVLVAWEVIAQHGRRKLRLTWSEHDGPPVQPPAHRGFGLVLLQEVLPKQCAAKVEVAFKAGGLQVAIETPLVEHRHVPLYA